MRPYFDSARVSVAPLKIGGGTRVKILEAQAMARPVVSTSIGAEGLGMSDGDSILIADDARLFASHVARLLVDDGLATRIGWNGRREVLAYYDWNRIGEQLESILRQHVGLASRDHSKHPPRPADVNWVASLPSAVGTEKPVSAGIGHSAILKRALT